jgi:hypothetical protein
MVMKNAMAWTMLAVAAMTAPALAGGARTPAANPRTPGSSRLGTALPAMPIGSGSGQTIELGEGYSLLEKTSIFDAHRGLGPTTTTTGPKPGDIAPPPPRALPVYRAAMFDDVGPVALLEIPDLRGRTTVEYLREGDTFSWDGSTVVDITPDVLSLSRTSSSGQVTTTEVAIGRDFSGRKIGDLPTTPSYVPLDASGARTNGIGMTRPRGRGVTPGGLYNTGTLTTPGPLGALTGSPLDPPLPPGSADALAARMMQRRQNQLSALIEPASMPATSGVR